ncbi:hypothetical protein Salat_2799300 [Sesamum alatum]|uniref:Uncharacterized protein n=1 Tax=Sesamum alatum TaxID=300844 RepID=A0AAE1XL02_9LAMI|nr:hypothetical protein Salat_2799300 [Sesamum alatum]
MDTTDQKLLTCYEYCFVVSGFHPNSNLTPVKQPAAATFPAPAVVLPAVAARTISCCPNSHQVLGYWKKSLCVGVQLVLSEFKPVFQSLLQAIFRPSKGAVLSLFWVCFSAAVQAFFRPESTGLFFMVLDDQLLHLKRTSRFAQFGFDFQRVFSLSGQLSVCDIALHFYRCLVGLKGVLLLCSPSPHRSLASSCAQLFFKVSAVADGRFSWCWANKNQLVARCEEPRGCTVFSAFSG